MAHDKSTRFSKLVTQTPPLVGPGSYEVYESSKPPRDLQRTYPFLSGARRKTFQTSNDARDLPGPGSYDPKEPKRHVPGGVSIDFTDVRLKPKLYEGPGPTSYRLSDDLFKNVKPKLRSHPGTWRGPAGNLWLGPPPRSLMTDVNPTIPSRNDTNGYRLDARGILVKNPPPKVKPLDFYDVPSGDSNAVTSRYKGNFWSLMSERVEKTVNSTPGPGAYELDRSANCVSLKNEAFWSIKRAASRQYRYLDKLWAQKLRENYPAPNSYDPPKGSFDKGSCACDEYVVEPPPFGYSAKRFETERPSEIPGPGAYDPREVKCSSCSKMLAPFGAWASRFVRPATDSGPGPASYDLSKDDLARRIFGSCKRWYARPPLRRTNEGSSIRHEDAPSDEFPVIDDPAHPKRSGLYHAVFKSTTLRFKDARPRGKGLCPSTGSMPFWPRIMDKHTSMQKPYICIIGIEGYISNSTLEDDAPGPGAYDVVKAFKASRDPCSSVQNSSAFASKSKRFPRIPYGLDLLVPGPGIYNLSDDIAQGIKGGVVGCANERTKKPDTTPGPQKYCLHPYIASSVLRKSHNVTLGKPKIVGEQDKFRNPWLRRCRAKKVLRCFAQPEAKYEHCISRRCDQRQVYKLFI